MFRVGAWGSPPRWWRSWRNTPGGTPLRGGPWRLPLGTPLLLPPAEPRTPPPPYLRDNLPDFRTVVEMMGRSRTAVGCGVVCAETPRSSGQGRGAELRPAPPMLRMSTPPPPQDQALGGRENRDRLLPAQLPRPLCYQSGSSLSALGAHPSGVPPSIARHAWGTGVRVSGARKKSGEGG